MGLNLEQFVFRIPVCHHDFTKLSNFVRLFECCLNYLMLSELSNVVRIVLCPNYQMLSKLSNVVRKLPNVVRIVE